jgi:quercetin dioxygenase-like cupin family protein
MILHSAIIDFGSKEESEMNKSGEHARASKKVRLFWRRWMVIPVALGIVGLLAATPGAVAITGSSDGAFDAAVSSQEPFTFRGELDPYRINQPSDLLINSLATTEVVMQRSVFLPSAGAWHTHPGPSFVLVEAGEIKLVRSTKSGCVETEVFGAGQAYVEVANEVHRAVVVSTENAVLHVTRLIPAGAPITTPAADPGC